MVCSDHLDFSTTTLWTGLFPIAGCRGYNVFLKGKSNVRDEQIRDASFVANKSEMQAFDKPCILILI